MNTVKENNSEKDTSSLKIEEKILEETSLEDVDKEDINNKVNDKIDYKVGNNERNASKNRRFRHIKHDDIRQENIRQENIRRKKNSENKKFTSRKDKNTNFIDTILPSYKHNLYIVYSNKNPEEIYLYLLSLPGISPQQIGPVRRDYSRNDKGQYLESNRRITLLDEDVYNILNNRKLLNIKPYDIREDNYPPSDSVFHLYYPIKKGDETSLITRKIDWLNNLKISFECEIIEMDIFGIVKFGDSIPDIKRILVKIILDDVDDFRVSWCKKKAFKT